MALLIVIDLALLALIAWPVVLARVRLPTPSGSPTPSQPGPSLTPTPSPSPTIVVPSDTATVSPEIPTPLASPPYPASSDSQAVPQGWVILALSEGLDTHLFAYQPQSLPLTRLTAGPWDDITPALSPDGRQVAFASNRNGYWDLYRMWLATGEITRLTDSPEYEAAPSWSPDGRWIVYEAYSQDNGGLDLYIRAVQESQPPIRLTEHPAADYAPAWSPQGRQVAFISTRSGEPEVWLADLDQAGEERFTNLSQDSQASEAHPAWSPDGLSLAWSAVKDGYHSLYVWNNAVAEQADPVTGQRLRSLGSGDWPVWSPDGEILMAVLLDPNRTYLAAYPVEPPGLVWPPFAAPGEIAGIAWGKAEIRLPLIEPLAQAARLTPYPLWSPAITPDPAVPGGRGRLVELVDVEAPYPLLHDRADESFSALRAILASEIGWDFLSSLENAYVPLTKALDPGLGNDWLYTGRAFAFTSLPMNAGWLVVVREDFGLQTYWRVYLRARFQDGSAGMPLHSQPWDFNARYLGDPAAYERGGALVQFAPPGYWVDFTRFCAAFGWERVPALGTWRSYFPAARFNELIHSDGLDWYSAMLDLYPPEALITPTALVPATRTLTPTPRWYRTPTPTPTSTPRPTFTPIVSTPTATLPPPITNTPSPSPTAPPSPSQTLSRAPTLTLTPTPAATRTATPQP